MDIFHSLLLGIVEGITEFLPVSSTGHLILASELLKIPETDFLKTFEIVIQLGAILAVVVMYPRRLFLDRHTIMRVASGFIPTAVLGLLFYKIIKTYLLGNGMIVIASLFVGGVAIVFLERYFTKKHDGGDGVRTIADLSLKESAIIGTTQALAFVPGVSRSAATIFGAMWLGLSRKEAVEFSFFLAVPTMAAATGLDVVKNIHLFADTSVTPLVVGLVVSFLTALIAVKFLLRYVATNNFIPFAIYRMLIALFLAWVLFV